MIDDISDAAFRQVLQACPLSVHELATKLSVRRPVIERWLMGKDLPGQALKEAVLSLTK